MAYLTADEVIERHPDRLDDGDAATVALLVAEFERIAERYRGVAYEPRTVTVEVVPSRGVATLHHVQVRTVTAATVVDGGATVEVGEIDKAGGRVALPSGLRLSVTYTHGLDEPPETILAACAEYVMRRVVNGRSGTSRDVLSQGTDGGTTRYSTPDWDGGRPTGYLQVDALLNAEHDYRQGLY